MRRSNPWHDSEQHSERLKEYPIADAQIHKRSASQHLHDEQDILLTDIYVKQRYEMKAKHVAALILTHSRLP